GPSLGLPEVRAAMAKMVRDEFGVPAGPENVVVGPGAKPFVQLAGKAALEHDAAERDDAMRQFRRKVERLVAELQQVDGVTAEMPPATFYVFPDVRPICARLGITSHGLAMYLLEGADDKTGVGCLGGECFGE